MLELASRDVENQEDNSNGLLVSTVQQHQLLSKPTENAENQQSALKNPSTNVPSTEPNACFNTPLEFNELPPLEQDRMPQDSRKYTVCAGTYSAKQIKFSF